MWERWVAEAPERASLAPLPFVERLRSFFDDRKKSGCVGTSFAAQGVAEGPWAQARAYASGAAADSCCQLCLADGVHVAGTTQHRLEACPGLRRHSEALPATWQHTVAHSPDRLLWE